MSTVLEFKKRLPEASTPFLATPGSAGLDLTATAPVVIAPGAWVKADTGLTVAIPKGYVGFICPRSGLSSNFGIAVLHGELPELVWLGDAETNAQRRADLRMIARPVIDSTTVLNNPGIIDSDYRGPLIVLLINHGEDPFEISVGDRIAQLVVVRGFPTDLELREVQEFEEEITARGTGGFGSTGISSK